MCAQMAAAVQNLQGAWPHGPDSGAEVTLRDAFYGSAPEIRAGSGPAGTHALPDPVLPFRICSGSECPNLSHPPRKALRTGCCQ